MTTQELIQSINKDISEGNIGLAKKKIGNLAITCKTFTKENEAQFMSVINAVKQNGSVFENLKGAALISSTKTSFTANDFDDAVYALKENLCEDRVKDVIKIGKAVYGSIVKEEVKPVQKVNVHINEDTERKNAQRVYRNNQQRTSAPKNNHSNSLNPLALVAGGIAIVGAVIILKKIFF